MAWARIEDDFTGNPKIVELSDSEFRTWMRLLCYCAKHRDPTVDHKTQREVSGLTSRRVGLFSSLGLLDQLGSTYEVHDWLKYQPRDMTNAARQARFRSRKGVTASVTPPVTSAVTETVTPSRAGATVPSRTTTELRQERSVLPADGSETTRNGLPVSHELQISKLLSFVGEHGDDATAGTIRGLSRRLPEGALAKVLESAQSRNGLESRAAYVVGALKSEVAEREKVKA